MDEAATTILCSCKQTRFHIENPVYPEVGFSLSISCTVVALLTLHNHLDIDGLNITVTSGNSASKSKGKARAEGLEIVSNASLKLKPGVHHALIGRNGTGKSSK